MFLMLFNCMGVGLKNFGKGKKGYKGILLFAKKNKDCAERCSPYSIIS